MPNIFQTKAIILIYADYKGLLYKVSRAHGCNIIVRQGRNTEDHQTSFPCKYRCSLTRGQHFDSTLPPETHTHTHTQLIQYLNSMSKYVFILSI